MTTISLKVPAMLDLRLAQEAQRRRTSKSAVIRECVETALLTPREGQAASCLDLAGCLEGSRDIATNPKYLGDFGRDHRFAGEEERPKRRHRRAGPAVVLRLPVV